MTGHVEKSEFIKKAERRAARRVKYQQHDAHVRLRFGLLSEMTRPVVQAAVRMQRALSGATGEIAPPVYRPDMTSLRMVQDPSMTDAEFYHQQQREMRNAGRVYRKPNFNVGKVEVAENLSTRIGGLAFVKRRLDHHERAAERFKNSYEAAYGSANPAAVLGKVQVDNSLVAGDNGIASLIDRNRDLKDAIDALGSSANIVIGVIVLGASVADVAPRAHWRSQRDTTSELLMALDSLAVRWGYLHSKLAAVDNGD